MRMLGGGGGGKGLKSTCLTENLVRRLYGDDSEFKYASFFAKIRRAGTDS